MKKIPSSLLVRLHLLLFLSLTANFTFAQVPGFYGTTNSGGDDDAGTIFRMDPDGTGLTTIKSFTYSALGSSADEFGVQMWQSPAGKLYSIAATGGKNGVGVIYEYDPAADTYTVVHNFNSATGDYPVNSLVPGPGGKLYGSTSTGGSNDKGVIYEFDYTTRTYTKKADFTGTNGANPSGGSLYYHTNGKMYGFAAFGGANNFGVLFEFDPATGTLTKKIDFTGPNGKYPYSGLVRAGNNKLYSVTLQGGTVDLGTLIEYDPVANTVTKRIDFSSSNGSYPASNMVAGDDGNLYGTSVGGGTSGSGVIFQFNPATGVYTKKINCTPANGNAPIGGLAKGTNGKLYGLTSNGGSQEAGVLYEYDPATNVYTKKFDFLFDQPTNVSVNGYAPRSTPLLASDGMIYATTSFGGASGRGTIFQYNLATGAFSKKVDFNGAPLGRFPYAGLTRALNGKLYGMTNSGGIYGEGIIYEINPSTNAFVKKYDFNRTQGSYPQGSMVLGPNGKLYGLTYIGGGENGGVLFEFDPATGAYVNKYEFGTGVTGKNPRGSLILASNNKMYGLANQGGSNGNGAIFEFDPSTGSVTMLADFDANTSGYGPVGDLLQASNGKFYGLTRDGGSNGSGQGVLFEFDLNTGGLISKVNFTISNGESPEGSLVQAPNGMLYGTTTKGGANGAGVLFEFDPAGGSFTKKYDFGANGQGIYPTGVMALSSNGKLYGGTPYGGANSKGTIFEFDPATGAVQEKHSFSGTDGTGFLFSRLLFVKGVQTITFGALADQTLGNSPFTLSATSSTGLPVTYSSSNTSVATISGNTVTLVGAGTVVITASQAGDANYEPAPSVTQTLQVLKTNQTITFGSLASKSLSDAPFTLNATASSSLPVSYATTSSHVTLAGAQVTIVSAGRVTIEASQAGNNNFNAATPVSQSFCIAPATPVVTLSDANTSSPTLTSSASAGNQWYRNGTAIAGATGNTYKATQAGVYTVRVTIEDCPGNLSAEQALVVTGDVDTSPLSGVSLYPNPSSEWVVVSFGNQTGRKSIRLMDLNGHVLSSQLTENSEAKVHVGNHANGMYLVTIETEKGVGQIRFMKK